MKLFKRQNVLVTALLLLTMTCFSCAKKATGVRSIRQTESHTTNPIVSNTSVTAGHAQNVDYTVTVVELPLDSTDGTFVVTAEIKTPTGKFIPITTTHSLGKDVNGVYNDTESNNQLDIRARCLGEKCDTYLLLVTVIKNNSSVHQVSVISRATETFFNVENINAYVAGAHLYYGLDEVMQRNNLH